MTHTIENNFLKVKISSFGAELTSIVHQDNEYIWQAAPEVWGRSGPVMFPITGGWEDDTYQLNSNTYKMRKHGFTVDSEFAVKSKDSDRITFNIRSDEETLKQYPFDFDLDVEYCLNGKSLDVRFTVNNLSGKTMPFAAGIHPGFKWPVSDTESEEDYYIEFEKPESIDACSVNGNAAPFLKNGSLKKLNRDLFAKEALCINSFNSDYLDFAGRDHKIRINKGDFKSIVLWSQGSADAKYLCIEPVTGFRKQGPSFYDHNGIIELDINETRNLSCSIEILE